MEEEKKITTTEVTNDTNDKVNNEDNNNNDENDTRRIINPDGVEIEICDNPLEDSRYVDALEYIKDKKYDEAIELLSDVLEDCQELIEKSDSNCGYVNYYYSYCLTKVIFAKLLQTEKPTSSTPDEEDAEELILNDIESAWESAELARVLLSKDNSPLIPEVYILLGDLGRLQGNTKQALEDYMHAKDLCEDKAAAYCNIGECFSDLFENIKFGKTKKTYKRDKTALKGEDESSSSEESGGEEKIEEEQPNKPADNKKVENAETVDLTTEEDANFFKDEAIKYYTTALTLCNDKLTKFCTDNNIDIEGDTEFKKLYGKFDNKDITPEEDKMVEVLLYRSVIVDKLKFFDEPFQKQDKFDEPTIKDAEPHLIEVRKRKKDSSKDGEPNKMQKTE